MRLFFEDQQPLIAKIGKCIFSGVNDEWIFYVI